MIEILSNKYTDSVETIEKGHLVVVDERKGKVCEVLSPHSKEARGYSCEKTGGLLIQFDDGILELLPFGHIHRITKWVRDE